MDKKSLNSTKLEEYFLTEHADTVDWYYVSVYLDINNFSESFFHRFRGKINWSIMSYDNKSVNESFIDRFSDYVDWAPISLLKDYKEDFWKKYSHKIDHHNFLHNRNISSTFAYMLVNEYYEFNCKNR